MFQISHNKYNSDSDGQNNDNTYSEDIIFMYNNETLQDLQDIDLLQVQWQAQLILVLGYLLEYTGSIQGIEILNARIIKRNEVFQSGEYDETQEIELADEVEEEFENIGINADATVLLAAQLELFGQTFLTNIAWIKYQRLPINSVNEDFLLTKSATREIFIGAVFEEIAYIFNLIGASILYELNNTDSSQNGDEDNNVDDE